MIIYVLHRGTVLYWEDPDTETIAAFRTLEEAKAAAQKNETKTLEWQLDSYAIVEVKGSGVQDYFYQIESVELL